MEYSMVCHIPLHSRTTSAALAAGKGTKAYLRTMPAIPHHTDQQAHNAVTESRDQAAKKIARPAEFVPDTHCIAGNRGQQTCAQLACKSLIPYGEIRLARQQQTERIDIGRTHGCP